MTKTFSCTPDQFAKLRAELTAEGVAVPDGNLGQIDSGMGFKVSFAYDNPSLVLTIIDKTCWLPTTSQIWDQMQKHLG